MPAASKWQSSDEEGSLLWGRHGLVLARFGCVRPSRPPRFLSTWFAVAPSRTRLRPTSRKARIVVEQAFRGITNKDSVTCPTSRARMDLYRAALSEIDTTKLPDRIVQAQEALVLRARALFHMSGANIEEKAALDDAMYGLHALRRTSQTSHSLPYRSEAA
jgi:hypothetical protein